MGTPVQNQSHTYIGYDRELADSTENVVPNPWRWRSKGCAYLWKGKGQENGHGDKETMIEGQSGVREKKVIRSFRIEYFTFTQRLTELTYSHVTSVPMSLRLMASGRRISVTNFAASRRISMTLLSKANAGASGKEATNSDTNPYCITVNINKHI